MIIWEEVIKEGDDMCELRIQREPRERETRDCAVQTEKEGETPDKVCNLIKDFPNLKTGRGFLPDLELPKVEKKRPSLLEWTVVVYPCNQGGGRRVICPSPSYNVPPLEGD